MLLKRSDVGSAIASPYNRKDMFAKGSLQTLPRWEDPNGATRLRVLADWVPPVPG
jgi:hypothetical protein